MPNTLGVSDVFAINSHRGSLNFGVHFSGLDGGVLAAAVLASSAGFPVMGGASDSFGLLPTPSERISFVSSRPRLLDIYVVPEDPAEATLCEACQ